MRPRQLQQDHDFFGSTTAENFWPQFPFAAQILCIKKKNSKGLEPIDSFVE